MLHSSDESNPCLLACISLVSVPVMVKVIEDTIKIYFNHLSSPTNESSNAESGYGWGSVSGSLCVPQTAYNEFSSVCIQEFACLSLHTHLLQQFPLCTSLAQELDIGSLIIDWCSKLRPK